MVPYNSLGNQSCPVFVVSKVINASGGRTGCFLYSGSLVTPLPRSTTPDRFGGAAGCLEARSPEPDCFDAEGEVDLSEYEGQQLTLYMSYEEASPKMKQRCCGAAAAPWRAILRDQQDDMLFCMRGLPTQVCLDAQLSLVTWGPSIAVAFPTAEDAKAFVQGLCRVDIEHCCLVASPPALLLAAHSAQQALSGAAPAQHAQRRAASQATSGTSACPPSPDRRSDKPTAVLGCKRKAEAPAALRTPVVKPRLLATLMSACSEDLGFL